MRSFFALICIAAPAALAAPTVTLAPAVLAQPGASGLHGIGLPLVYCAPTPCATGDQSCRQASFEEALGCLTQADALIAPQDAEALRQTQVFRASGGGVVLYGTFGRPAGPAALRALAAQVE
jgi:hypothetical protein